MSWLRPVRIIGVVAGLLLFGLGIAWLLAGLSDPPSRNYGSFVLFDVSLLVPGALTAAPWSRIHSRPVWYTLFVVLLLTVLPGAAFILAVNTCRPCTAPAGPDTRWPDCSWEHG